MELHEANESQDPKTESRPLQSVVLPPHFRNTLSYDPKLPGHRPTSTHLTSLTAESDAGGNRTSISRVLLWEILLSYRKRPAEAFLGGNQVSQGVQQATLTKIPELSEHFDSLRTH